jgi:programmed cell death protein 5
MVKSELANMVENYLLGLASQGRATGQITDEQLKQILLSAQKPKKDFKINRI